MNPVPVGAEIHYEWLQQGQQHAALSSAPPFTPQVLDLQTLDPRALVAALRKEGVVCLTNHGIDTGPMFTQSRAFFAMSTAEKAKLQSSPTPGPALQYVPVGKSRSRSPSPTGRLEKKVVEPPVEVKPRSPSPVRSVEKKLPEPPVELKRRSPSPVRSAVPAPVPGPSPPSRPSQPFESLTPSRQPFERPPDHRVYMKARVEWTPPRIEQLNPFTKPDVKETYDWSLVIDKATGASHLGVPRFPSAGFEAVAVPYCNAHAALAHQLLQAIARGVGLAADAFDVAFDKPLGIQRVLRYPPQNMEEKDALGAGAHVDYGAVTLLHEDSPGLEVYASWCGWRQVRCPPGAVILNVGFMLEKLCGGAVRATQHRVINRNSMARFSTAFFYDPNPAAQITPLLPVNEGDKTKYKACVAGQKGIRYAVSGYASKALDQQ